MSEFRTLVERYMAGIASLSENQLEALEAHYEVLLRWNERMNLTAIRRPVDIVRRHYCESLFLGLCLPAGARSVADVGSGAGFPGVPLAVLRPEVGVWLVESNSRKCVFLREATRTLGNVTVHEGRGEEIDLSFGWVTSRAVAWESLRKIALRIGRGVALLAGDRAWSALQSDVAVAWEPPVRLPWGEQLHVVIGTFHVKRPTAGLFRQP